ncbi:hypothetical protein JCM1841_002068 [Sporobolomyces salmonicolor]
MGEGDFSAFVLCAVRAGVPPSLVTEVMDAVELEPHNPPLDVDDDDSAGEDINAEAAKAAVDDLLNRFSSVFVNELPGLPPLQPINHEIPLVEGAQKV